METDDHCWCANQAAIGFRLATGSRITGGVWFWASHESYAPGAINHWHESEAINSIFHPPVSAIVCSYHVCFLPVTIRVRLINFYLCVSVDIHIGSDPKQRPEDDSPSRLINWCIFLLLALCSVIREQYWTWSCRCRRELTPREKALLIVIFILVLVIGGLATYLGIVVDSDDGITGECDWCDFRREFGFEAMNGFDF